MSYVWLGVFYSISSSYDWCLGNPRQFPLARKQEIGMLLQNDAEDYSSFFFICLPNFVDCTVLLSGQLQCSGVFSNR